MLPTNASSASHARFLLAQTLETKCPPGFGQAIAITGSVSRGLADHFSDLELNFWVDKLDPVTEYQAWLQSIGAKVEPDTVTLDDASVWTKSWWQGVLVEAGWQAWEALDARLGAILAAEITEHPPLTMAWTVRHAVPLRQHTRLEVWQRSLEHYPDALRERLLAETTRTWAAPPWGPVSVINIWPPVYRQSLVELAGRLSWEIEKVLRLLFAFNQQWEPEWKWLESESDRLKRRPERLVERIQAVVAGSDAEQRARGCLQLILDTLALVAETQDVALPIQRVQEALAFDLRTGRLTR
jgi:hypothetical protein